jgi:hypothetical protein
LHYEDSFKEMMVKFAIEYADEVSGNGWWNEKHHQNDIELLAKAPNGAIHLTN